MDDGVIMTLGLSSFFVTVLFEVVFLTSVDLVSETEFLPLTVDVEDDVDEVLDDGNELTFAFTLAYGFIFFLVTEIVDKFCDEYGVGDDVNLEVMDELLLFFEASDEEEMEETFDNEDFGLVCVFTTEDTELDFMLDGVVDEAVLGFNLEFVVVNLVLRTGVGFMPLFIEFTYDFTLEVVTLFVVVDTGFNFFSVLVTDFRRLAVVGLVNEEVFFDFMGVVTFGFVVAELLVFRVDEVLDFNVDDEEVDDFMVEDVLFFNVEDGFDKVDVVFNVDEVLFFKLEEVFGFNVVDDVDVVFNVNDVLFFNVEEVFGFNDVDEVDVAFNVDDFLLFNVVDVFGLIVVEEDDEEFDFGFNVEVFDFMEVVDFKVDDVFGLNVVDDDDVVLEVEEDEFNVDVEEERDFIFELVVTEVVVLGFIFDFVFKVVDFVIFEVDGLLEIEVLLLLVEVIVVKELGIFNFDLF